MKAFLKWHIVYLIVISFLAVWLYSEMNKPQFSDPSLDTFAGLLERARFIGSQGGVGRECFRTNFQDYPETHEYYKEVEGKEGLGARGYDGGFVFTEPGRSCMKDLKLVSMEHSTRIYGNYEVVFRCEKDGVGEELKLGSFKNDCQYTAYLTKWDFPVGKYTYVAQP